MALFITYDNKSLQDGIGAQALRITGIFAISRKYKINYIHSPIVRVAEEVAHNFHSTADSQTLIHQVNDFFRFPDSMRKPKSNHLEIYLRQPTVLRLLLIRLRSFFSLRDITVKILFPFSIMDKSPASYKFSQNFLRIHNREILEQHQSRAIVLHVRWGYGWMYTAPTNLRKKFIPAWYYLRIVEELLQQKFRGDFCDVHIHTDAIRQTFNWKPANKDVLSQYAQLHSLNEVAEIEIDGIDLSKIFKSNSFRNYVIYYAAPFFETFLDMCNAQHLIMSCSAFSYLAGIINSNEVIYPMTHGHAKLRNWISSTELGVPLDKDDMCLEGSKDICEGKHE